MFDAADAAEREKEKTDLRLLKQAGGPLLYEQRIKDRILETTKFRVNLENGRVGIGGILRDVTERKQAEESLRVSEALQTLLLQNIDAGVLIIDAKTHVIERANSKALEMFGDTEEKVIGKECQRFVCPAEKGRCPVTDLGQVIDRSERVLLTSDGSRVPIIKTARPIRIGGDDKILETFIDITERKRAERPFRRAKRDTVNWPITCLRESTRRHWTARSTMRTRRPWRCSASAPTRSKKASTFRSHCSRVDGSPHP